MQEIYQKIINEIKDYHIYTEQIDNIDVENKIIYTYDDYYNSGIFEINISYGTYTVMPITIKMIEDGYNEAKELTNDIFQDISNISLHGDFNKF